MKQADCVLWILLALLFVNQDKEGNRVIQDNNTEVIVGNIAHPPELRKSTKNIKSLTIKLTQFSSFIFKLNGQELKALDEEFIKEVKEGEEISLRIWKNTYEKKISAIQDLTFRDKHFKFHEIDILGISKSQKEYLPVQSVNRYRKKFHTKGNYYGLMLLAFFGIAVGIGFYIVGLVNKS